MLAVPFRRTVGASDSWRWLEAPQRLPPGLALLGLASAMLLAGCEPRELLLSSEEGLDLIVHNAVVWTGEPEAAQGERPTAVGVAGDRFVAVGAEEEVLALAGPATRVLDAGGRLLVPGFIDSHVHFAQAARFLEFNLMATSTQEELVARVEEAVSELAPGEWIVGGFWGAYDAWAPGTVGGDERGRFTPDMALVEELTAEHPVFLRRFDDSEFAANRPALAAAGIDPAAPPEALPEGVELVRDGEGRATGILRGPSVAALFAAVVPRELSRERRLRQSRRALAVAARHGVTGVSDMSDDEQLEIYRQLRDAGELTLRVDFRYPLERWEELAAAGVRAANLESAGDEWIRFGRLKGHVDGIMGNSTARFFAPYDHDPGNRGRWRHLLVGDAGGFDDRRFRELLAGADGAGLQLTIHAIGDEANRLLLSYLEELQATDPPPASSEPGGGVDRRFRVVHAQVLALEDLPRLGELGAIAEVQPVHLADDMRWMEERIGTERSRGAYAFRSLMEGGALLAFGSDWPGTAASEYPIDPMPGLFAAVARQTLAGLPPGGWFPDQAIGIEEALSAYTWNNAYASFEEGLKGSIAVGKLADFAVLSRNLLEIPAEEILGTEALLTVVGGRIVHQEDID
jgi:predicted amidohydrolase YtcJ